MQYPQCESCANYFLDECQLDHPCTDGVMGLSDYEPRITEHEIDYE